MDAVPEAGAAGEAQTNQGWGRVPGVVGGLVGWLAGAWWGWYRLQVDRYMKVQPASQPASRFMKGKTTSTHAPLNPPCTDLLENWTTS